MPLSHSGETPLAAAPTSLDAGGWVCPSPGLSTLVCPSRDDGLERRYGSTSSAGRAVPEGCWLSWVFLLKTWVLTKHLFY